MAEMTIAQQGELLKQDFDDVYEAGKQAQYDEFWDVFQNKGARIDYIYAFSNNWNDATFKPKYNMAPTIASSMFYYSSIGNLKEILSAYSITLDTSKIVNFSYGFSYSTISHIPIVDLSKCTTSNYLFANYGTTSPSYYRNQLQSIEKIISSETTVFANNAFSGCYHLSHCIFEGTIASNINLQWCTKLSVESLISLFKCLKDFGNDPDSAPTITLSPESWALTETEEFKLEFTDLGIEPNPEGHTGKNIATLLFWNWV